VSSLLAYYVLHTLIDDRVGVPLAVRLEGAADDVLVWSILGLPSILILSIALRWAPRQGVRRWLWAIGAAGLGTLWGNRAGVLLFHFTPGFDHISEAFVTLLLISVGCFLHNTVRNGEADLFRTQIESTALDAEFSRAQLELLRAQIEPHFLFNTLATVRTLAYAEPKAAALLVDNLLRYFMAALPKLRRGESSLEDEIGLVDAYLRIQQVRMGARLSYDILIPTGLKDARVPSVMLLTLVENAIKHGIGPAAEGGAIWVSAAQEAAMLTLKVVDSGQGMQAQLGYGSGLANIRTRLELLYRERASLSLEPRSPRGVAATIKLPVDVPA
jgi:Histidine kinase